MINITTCIILVKCELIRSQYTLFYPLETSEGCIWNEWVKRKHKEMVEWEREMDNSMQNNV